MNKNNVSPGPNKRSFQSMKGETVRKLAFSKTTLFLSFQIAYSRCKGAANQTFFSIFFTRIAFQPMIRSLAKRGQIHTVPKQEKRPPTAPRSLGSELVNYAGLPQPLHIEDLLTRETPISWVDSWLELCPPKLPIQKSSLLREHSNSKASYQWHNSDSNLDG